MSKICSICGKTIEDNAEICPFCNNSLNNQNQEETIQSEVTVTEEQPTKAPNEDVQSFDIEKLEQQESLEPSTEATTMPQTPVETIISTEDNKMTSSSPVEISDTVIETNTLNDEVNNTFEEVIVDNVNLETVAVEANNITLEEEEQKIEMPEIPDATIGEINPDLLGNFYAESERQNNEKRALKQQQEAEQERIRQEEALKNASIPVARPDLLAGVNLNGEEIPHQLPKQPKPKKGKSLKIIILLLIIIILLVVLWFFVLKDNI